MSDKWWIIESSHLIITRRARTIITIISTTRRILSRLRCRRRSKSAKTRLTASNVTYLGVHLTHLIKKIVKTTTKISTNELKLIHNSSKRCLNSKRGIWSRRWIGSRGKSKSLHSIKSSRLLLSWSRIHTRLLSSQLCITPLYRFLIDSRYRVKERRRRNGDVQVCEDKCDSWRKDYLIMSGSVSIDIYHRYYHMWWKIYRKIFQKGKKKTSMRLSNSVIVRPWCENKGHHHIKDPWTLSKLVCGEIKSISPHLDFLTKWATLGTRSTLEMSFEVTTIRVPQKTIVNQRIEVSMTCMLE